MTTPVSPPTVDQQDVAAQVRRLVDRALISDLMVTFARALDERDWDTYANTYTEDGVFAIGSFIKLAGRDKIKMMTSSQRGIGGYEGTWHLSSNHSISIDGDTARLHCSACTCCRRRRPTTRTGPAGTSAHRGRLALHPGQDQRGLARR